MGISSNFPQKQSVLVDTEWIRPADWIDIDNITDGNINLLVNDAGLATYAFICTTSSGSFHVDWGDGSSVDYASGATAEHTYIVGSGQACSRGYGTFKIVISPSVGQNLTRFYVVRHSLTNSDQYQEYLQCVWAARYVTSMANAFYKKNIGTLSVYCKRLESFRFVGVQAATNIDASAMFYSCSKLRTVDISNMTEIINGTEMFSSCRMLTSINIVNLSKVTNATSMFSGCSSLTTIDISSMTQLTNATSMFYQCYNLLSLDLSNTTNLNNAYQMCIGCASLNTINIGNLSKVTDATGMLSSCSSLDNIDISSMTRVTNAASMLAYCYILKSINSQNFSSLAANLDATQMFRGCEQLTNINLPNAKLTAFGSYGSSATNLDKLETIIYSASSTFSGTAPQFSIMYCTLTADQLNVIFTALPTVTSKTISITGCIGAATCDKTIATAKGWTVTG